MAERQQQQPRQVRKRVRQRVVRASQSRELSRIKEAFKNPISVPQTDPLKSIVSRARVWHLVPKKNLSYFNLNGRWRVVKLKDIKPILDSEYSGNQFLEAPSTIVNQKLEEWINRSKGQTGRQPTATQIKDQKEKIRKDLKKTDLVRDDVYAIIGTLTDLKRTDRVAGKTESNAIFGIYTPKGTLTPRPSGARISKTASNFQIQKDFGGKTVKSFILLRQRRTHPDEQRKASIIFGVPTRIWQENPDKFDLFGVDTPFLNVRSDDPKFQKKPVPKALYPNELIFVMSGITKGKINPKTKRSTKMADGQLLLSQLIDATKMIDDPIEIEFNKWIEESRQASLQKTGKDIIPSKGRQTKKRETLERRFNKFDAGKGVRYKRMYFKGTTVELTTLFEPITSPMPLNKPFIYFAIDESKTTAGKIVYAPPEIKMLKLVKIDLSGSADTTSNAINKVKKGAKLNLPTIARLIGEVAKRRQEAGTGRWTSTTPAYSRLIIWNRRYAIYTNKFPPAKSKMGTEEYVDFLDTTARFALLDPPTKESQDNFNWLVLLLEYGLRRGKRNKDSPFSRIVVRAINTWEDKYTSVIRQSLSPKAKADLKFLETETRNMDIKSFRA